MAKVGRKLHDIMGRKKDGWEVVAVTDGKKVTCKCLNCGNTKVVVRASLFKLTSIIGKCLVCLTTVDRENSEQPRSKPPSQRDLEIVNLLENTKMTLNEVGEKYGITGERVRQIHRGVTGKSKVKFYNWEKHIGKKYGIYTVISYDEEKDKYTVECPNGHKKFGTLSVFPQLRYYNYNCAKCLDKSGKAKIRHEEIYNAYCEGMSLKDIAKKFNTTLGAIGVTLYRYYSDRVKRKPFGYTTNKKEKVK